ncbi:MAG TPA: DUF2071 domain-containing protein [Gemmatimonadales bacterium]|nr:DUF2071 domain-containing protein [Gemmatimonadales bacterium]
MLVHPSLQHLSHRPWPIPTRPWTLRQVWHDLLFLHWPVPAAILRTLVPPALEIQEFSGSAWLAVTPFWMSDIGFRRWRFPGGLSRFGELNIRTYVSRADRPGVWFFSLDAGSRLGALVGRWLYGLPYVHARIQQGQVGEEVRFGSTRRGGIGFVARYGPTGPPGTSHPGSLEHWLTERYCLYSQRSGELHRAEIHHRPWPLQPAAAVVTRNDLPGVHGIALGGPPALLHFSRKLEVIVWSLERVIRR